MNRSEPFVVQLPSKGLSELGFISIAEGESVPFNVKRVYWTYHTPQNVVRGHHAHKELEQILVAVSGIIDLTITTGDGKVFEFHLDTPDKGVYIPNMCWRTMKYSHNAVQLCLASQEYDEDDYIRDYDAFISINN